MKKLALETLTVESFGTTAATASARGTVAAHEVDSLRNCAYSYGGSCNISLCLACPTDAPCN